MLNKNGERELAYVVTVDEIRPIEGRDRVECAVVGGWTIMVRKGQFKPGDPGIYFEIDSKVPEREPFEFLAPKHYKIKTQKYKTPSGQFWSQGLLMSAEDFGWTPFNKVTWEAEGIKDKDCAGILDDENIPHFAVDESRFLTKKIGVTYAEAEDNKRKAGTPDKYKAMAQRHGKLFAKQPFRWLMRREWGKRLLFVFFGKKRDNNGWPQWVKKSDEERIQNMPWVLSQDTEWSWTEKIDGTSTTWTMRRGKHRWSKPKFIVASRNVPFKTGKEACFYDTNVYTEIAEKYDAYGVLWGLLKDRPTAEWVTVQGEIYGDGIQKRNYGLTNGEHRFAAFNLIYSDTGRLGTKEMITKLVPFNVPCVPYFGDKRLPDSVEEVLKIASGESVIDGGMREGIVYRSPDGQQSFKAVSNEYLLKYH